jgi:ABC-2 type transport system permease protein
VGGGLRRLHAADRAQDAQRGGDQLGGLIFFPLLFLTPNFVPRDMLTRPMEIAATLNPVTYVMEALRSLVLVDLTGPTSSRASRRGVAGAVMLALSVRLINRYD